MYKRERESEWWWRSEIGVEKQGEMWRDEGLRIE